MKLITTFIALTVVASATMISSPLLASGDNEHHKHHHKHQLVDVSQQPNIPSVDVEVTPDATAGWNLQIKTHNFEFAPQNANKKHVHGQGHAHLYVNGEKIGRLYGHWHHLPKLGAGEHSIKVTLNTNDHGAYAVNGTEIAVEKIINEE
ncbi:MAG: hypothetical protein HWD86_06025 [Kangiellaceae bacterium]|nr:hypothetical protein [Kangiellaceae bacterium]